MGETEFGIGTMGMENGGIQMQKTRELSELTLRIFGVLFLLLPSFPFRRWSKWPLSGPTELDCLPKTIVGGVQGWMASKYFGKIQRKWDKFQMKC
jgi:hypothetical protein